MKVFHFDPVSGLLIGHDEARLDGLETERALAAGKREPVYLLPANATFDPPPVAPDGQCAVFRDGAWRLVPDGRKEREWAGLRRAAAAALRASDVTVLRCYEASIPVPADWRAYREALRAILRAPAGDASAGLPSSPPRPAGLSLT